MKFKLFAFILALAVTTWAQAGSQSTVPPTSSPDTKAKCACCEKMASAKDAKGCCHQMKHKGGKAADCCGGKDAASCCGKNMQCGKNAKDKTAGCGGDKSCCGDGKDCCGSAKDSTTTAMACCGGQQCKMHHDGSGEMPE